MYLVESNSRIKDAYSKTASREIVGQSEDTQSEKEKFKTEVHLLLQRKSQTTAK